MKVIEQTNLHPFETRPNNKIIWFRAWHVEYNEYSGCSHYHDWSNECLCALLYTVRYAEMLYD